jgi:hypothetical protein
MLFAVPALASHSWGGAHWARTSTLTIRVGDSVGSAWDTYLRAAAKDWSAPAILDLAVTTSNVAPSTCKPVYGRATACSYAYGRTGWLGLGQIWTSGKHIVQGTAKVNNTYFAQARYNTPAWRRYVMCQELGHVLGLAHQDENSANPNLGSCMDYTSDPTGTLGTTGLLSNLKPNAHDYRQIAAAHGHLDSTQLSTTKVSASTSAAPAAEAERLGRGLGLTRSSWGRAVAADARGRGRVFVRDLGGGAEVLTFVIWSEEATPDQTGGHSH